MLRLADSVALRIASGTFARLAVAEAYPALLIAHDDERREGEAPAALDHLGHAVDVHQLVDDRAVAVVAIARAIPPVPAALPRAIAARALRSAVTTRTLRGACHLISDLPYQNSSPPSRAASASALTRPWNK